MNGGGYNNSSYGHGSKEEVDEHVFFSEAGGTTMRNNVTETSLHDSWQLTMGSPALMKHRSNYYSGTQTGHSAAAANNYLQLNDTNSTRQNQNQYYALGCGGDLKNDVPLTTMTVMEREDPHQQQQPKKVMHHFFDEWPPKDKDSWIDANEEDDDNDNGNNKLGSRSHHHHHQLHHHNHHNHHHHHAPASKIQLSISMPNTSHDFFMTRNGT